MHVPRIAARPGPSLDARDDSVWRWLRLLAIGGSALAAFLAETRSPLRERRESRPRRTARNLATAALTAAVVASLQTRLLEPVTQAVESCNLGILNNSRLPQPLRLAAGVLLLDYTLWWWHWANHRVPLLWRFHLVHHVDRDLDASTGLRFHFGEMLLSVFYRALQVRLLGVDRLTLSVWQTLLFASIFFHHSNTRLPEPTERLLVRALVTPRMHGIHHSDDPVEANTNWASLFTWWDMLHNTLLTGIPQESLTIGVPAYDDPAEVTFPKITALPFREQRDDWRVGEDRLPPTHGGL
jgi:sterol desaturase/sphingolipid hydroxylase (fatty acid hydroxylase superfamily)